MDMPRISDSELVIMKVLWDKSPLTSNQIIRKLDGYKNWSNTTIRTFLSRLVEKSAIKSDDSQKNHLFYPNISKEAFMKKENKSFIDRVYDGASDLLIAQLLDDEELTSEDLDRFEALLKNKKQ